MIVEAWLRSRGAWQRARRQAPLLKCADSAAELPHESSVDSPLPGFTPRLNGTAAEGEDLCTLVYCVGRTSPSARISHTAHRNRKAGIAIPDARFECLPCFAEICDGHHKSGPAGEFSPSEAKALPLQKVTRL
jgi:hypothetical protein